MSDVRHLVFTNRTRLLDSFSELENWLSNLINSCRGSFCRISSSISVDHSFISFLHCLYFYIGFPTQFAADFLEFAAHICVTTSPAFLTYHSFSFLWKICAEKVELWADLWESQGYLWTAACANCHLKSVWRFSSSFGLGGEELPGNKSIWLPNCHHLNQPNNQTTQLWKTLCQGLLVFNLEQFHQ